MKRFNKNILIASAGLVSFAACQPEMKQPTDAEIDAFYEENIKEPDDVVLSSSHPHGGNAINEDPEKGIVDLNQRVHGTTNCYVTDASVMPSCIRVNAQLTTMAMSHRAMAGKRRFG